MENYFEYYACLKDSIYSYNYTCKKVDMLEHGCWQACSYMLEVEKTIHDLMNKQTWTTFLEPSW